MWGHEAQCYCVLLLRVLNAERERERERERESERTVSVIESVCESVKERELTNQRIILG